MSTITNTALTSRTMSGVILISDGNGTIIENGNIETGDINSASLTTNNINTSSLTCDGIFRTNTAGAYTIPTSISNLTGLLISYGNVSNSGATDFTNFGSTYTTTQQGFRFFNKSNVQTLINLGIIDNTQTYFSSPLTGVTCETPVNATSVVNKTYVDSNFIDFTTDQTITGIKRFNTIFTGDHSWRDVVSPFSNRIQSYVAGTSLEIVPQFNNNIYRFYTKDGASTQTTPLSINSASTTITNSLITNNLTADNITGTQNIYTNNTTGIINIGTGQTSGGNINIGTGTSSTNVKSDLKVSKGLVLYDVVTPFSNFCQLYPSGVNMNYIMNAGTTTATTHQFYAYNTTNNSRKTLEITYNNVNLLDATIFSARIIRTSNASSAGHELFSGMTTGTLTMGSLTSFIINNSTNTLNAQHTFNNLAPISNTAPTLSSHLTTKNYTDTIFQTIANMTSYLTSATAASTYQTIAGMSSYLTSATAASTYQPMIVGSIIQMAMGTVPSGYLECNGASYSTSTYSALSAYLNFTYGGSAMSGLFQVPDFRGIFLRGKGTSGVDATYISSAYGSLQTDGIKSHTHDILFGYNSNVQGSGGSFNAYCSTEPNYNNPGPSTITPRSTGITSSNNNPYPDTRPGNFAVLFCIKY